VVVQAVTDRRRGINVSRWSSDNVDLLPEPFPRAVACRRIRTEKRSAVPLRPGTGATPRKTTLPGIKCFGAARSVEESGGVFLNLHDDGLLVTNSSNPVQNDAFFLSRDSPDLGAAGIPTSAAVTLITL